MCLKRGKSSTVTISITFTQVRFGRSPFFLALCSSVEAHSLPICHHTRRNQYFGFVDPESFRRGSVLPSLHDRERIDCSQDFGAAEGQADPNEWVKNGWIVSLLRWWVERNLPDFLQCERRRENDRVHRQQQRSSLDSRRFEHHGRELGDVFDQGSIWNRCFCLLTNSFSIGPFPFRCWIPSKWRRSRSVPAPRTACRSWIRCLGSPKI